MAKYLLMSLAILFIAFAANEVVLGASSSSPRDFTWTGFVGYIKGIMNSTFGDPPEPLSNNTAAQLRILDELSTVNETDAKALKLRSDIFQSLKQVADIKNSSHQLRPMVKDRLNQLLGGLKNKS